MKKLPHIAARVFGVPLMVEPRKMDVVINALGPRIGAYWDEEMDGGPQEDPKDRLPYTMAGSVAVIDVCGSLVNRMDADALSGMTNYEEIGAELVQAVNDPAVSAIVLRFDSFGGEVSGCFDLADLIEMAGKMKPICASIDDYAFSAAYLLASACSKVYITQTGGAGSIGVRAMHYDCSGWNEKNGVKPTAIFAGAKKNDMSPDAPLSDSAAADLQAEVDRVYDMFCSAVAARRGMTVEAIKGTQAGLYYGQEAISAGLADGIKTFRDVVAAMMAPAPSMATIRTNTRMGAAPADYQEPQQQESEMQNPLTPEPVAQAQSVVAPVAAQVDAALVADLCQLAGRIDLLPDFIKNMTSVADVRKALIDAKAAASEQTSIRSSAPGFSGNAETALQAAANAVLSANPQMTPQQAYTKALQQNPALYSQYLAANPAQTGGR